tara:strand:- start:752 stop:1459 length:708 start_codon:yes stop_codon:yes gene_type:complete
MAYGDLKCNNLIYDTGSGDATVQVSTIPDATDMAAKANLSGANFTGNVDLGDNNLNNVGTIACDQLKGDADDDTNITFAGGDVVAIKPAGTQRLAINTSGIDVTGTATVDGIDIDGSYQQAFDVITPATSPAIDCSLGNYFTLDLSSTNVSGTWTFTNVPTTKSFAIAIEITTGASTTVAWNSVSVNGGGGANTIKWAGGAAPTLGASKPSVVILTTDDTGASWYGSSLVDFATV